MRLCMAYPLLEGRYTVTLVHSRGDIRAYRPGDIQTDTARMGRRAEGCIREYWRNVRCKSGGSCCLLCGRFRQCADLLRIHSDARPEPQAEHMRQRTEAAAQHNRQDD